MIVLIHFGTQDRPLKSISKIHSNIYYWINFIFNTYSLWKQNVFFILLNTAIYDFPSSIIAYYKKLTFLLLLAFHQNVNIPKRPKDGHHQKFYQMRYCLSWRVLKRLHLYFNFWFMNWPKIQSSKKIFWEKLKRWKKFHMKQYEISNI